MTPDRWPEIERIYHAALNQDPVTRGAFLDDACAEDDMLRREVASLLAYDAASAGFLERTALQETAERISAERARSSTPLIAGYTILDLLGEGGMGAVYLAQQDAPLRRRVAVKVVKSGMDSRQVVARFEAERQALARMDHPNIAAVYDAGTAADGRPYFVMEHVVGEPITEYSDRHRLSTRERLGLFVQVCSAVQHAHQKGVIHRDLKPSNVLIASEDGRPRPTIIDFGIAKAVERSLDGQTGVTELGTVIGTPEYMSPEQAAFSSDIDTTTDVYSLGVLLYELLIGALPFAATVLRAAGHDELRRLIRESDPPKPSSRLTEAGGNGAAVAAARQTDVGRLTRDLRGDLDWITLKALEKDRRRRYPTALALAADVERHLADQPVEARPPSAVYRLRKFTRRYRGAVAGAAAVLLVLVAGLTASVTQYVRAERQRAEADRQTARAEAQRAAAEAASAEAIAQRNAALAATTEAERQRVAATNEAARAHDARREAEYRAYVEAIAAADGELRANLPGSARERLLTAPKDLRGWEWHHLFLESDTSLATLTAQKACPERVQLWVPNDHALVLQDGGRRISLRRCATLDSWDARTNTHVVVEANGHILAIGPASELLTAVSAGSASGSWEIQRITPGSTEPNGRLGPFETRPRCAEISPDGTRVAIGLQHANSSVDKPRDDVFEIWDVGATRRIARMVLAIPPWFDTRATPAWCLVAFSRDSTRVATSGATVHLWRADSGAHVASDRGQAGRYVQPIAFDADGTRLAIGRHTGLVDLLHLDGSGRVDHLDGNGFVKVRPLPDADRFLVTYRSMNEVRAIAFSPDGRRIITGTDRTVGMWDLSEGRLTAVLPGHDAEVVGVALAPDGRIVSADIGGTVKTWPAGRVGAVTVLPESFGLTPRLFAVSRDGTTVALRRRDGGISAWNLTDLNRVVLRAGTGRPDLERPLTSIAVSADGRQVLVGEGRARGAELGMVRAFTVGSGDITEWPLNSRLETGCENFDRIYGSVQRMALSPDGGSIAFQQGRDCIVVRDLGTMTTLAVSHEVPYAFDFRQDGLLVVASAPDYIPPEKRRGPGPVRIRVWDWRANIVRAEMPVPIPGSGPLVGEWRMALGADGGRVALLETGRSIVYTWDNDPRHAIVTLRMPAGTFHMAISPDGRRLATTARDTTVRIWDADRRVLLLSLIDDDEHMSGIAFTPDGRLVAGRTTGGLTIWETQKAALALPLAPTVPRQ
jgi:serine/threonine protein kinase/WD40 repeat protein